MTMRAPCDKPRCEQPGQFEMPEMVGAELDFEAIGGSAERSEHHPGVVHQHVDLGREVLRSPRRRFGHWPGW